MTLVAIASEEDQSKRLKALTDYINIDLAYEKAVRQYTRARIVNIITKEDEADEGSD